MSSKPKRAKESGGQAKGRDETRKRSSNKPSKKDQIISLFLSGMGEIADIAVITGARPSYVGSVLQEAGLHSRYFHPFTPTPPPQNIFSKIFSGQPRLKG